MLHLYSDSPRELYALEELHNSIGLVCQDVVSFVAGGSLAESAAPEAKATVLFVAEGGGSGILSKLDYGVDDGRLVVRGDLLGFIFRTLTREMEKDLPRDNLGRVRLPDDPAYKEGLHQTAYLDRLAGEFVKVLGEYLDERQVSWHLQRIADRPMVCMTHDVDGMHGQSWARYAAWIGSTLVRSGVGGLKRTAKRIALYRGAESDPLFPAEMFHEARADQYNHTFFVMSLPRALGHEGLRYSLNRRKTVAVFEKLMEAGHEIALHPSRKSQDSPQLLQTEKTRMLRSLGMEGQGLGMRCHYLKASFPETWRVEQRLAFKYDSTLGWTEGPGFRAGTARPYQPFDHENGERLALWELPLVAMDGALGGTAREIADRAVKISEECFANGGPATILWHTNRLMPYDFPEHANAYELLSAYFADKGCLGLTAGEVVDRFARHYNELSKQREAKANDMTSRCYRG
ncbi:MAG: hypothetical protein KKC30_13110 [Proteobacteria bacterium]|nr:hypothetical protein [Pseudomonadota bacterium]MBU4384647.1 hypothetical protein [Pseudomonadota bacterium]MCG2766205.1 hypothetical protein [Desulfarculaceae bacterium]